MITKKMKKIKIRGREKAALPPIPRLQRMSSIPGKEGSPLSSQNHPMPKCTFPMPDFIHTEERRNKKGQPTLIVSDKGYNWQEIVTEALTGNNPVSKKMFGELSLKGEKLIRRDYH